MKRSRQSRPGRSAGVGSGIETYQQQWGSGTVATRKQRSDLAKDPRTLESAMVRLETKYCLEWDPMKCFWFGLEIRRLLDCVAIRVVGQSRQQQQPLGDVADT